MRRRRAASHVTRARYGHPLRGASRLHIVPFCKVGASRSAKAALGAAHRCAPWRVYKTHNMQSALRWGRAPQPSALPGRIRALRAAAWSPRHGCGPLALVRRNAQGSVQWPAARCNVCAPARPSGPRRCAASASARAVRVPPDVAHQVLVAIRDVPAQQLQPLGAGHHESLARSRLSLSAPRRTRR